MTDKIKAYKVFDKHLKCQNFQFEVGKTFVHEGEVVPCESGFHACEKLIDCFNYKEFHLSIRVCEVELAGTVIEHGNKHVASEITLLRELAFWEIDEIVNKGVGNIGYGNEGRYNKGSNNKGKYNVGSSNVGSYNVGDNNKGDDNTGSYNKGDDNTGSYNKGNNNKGNYNTGSYNKGNNNKGNYNTGHYNKGDGNTGGQ